jgi:hypothetical protein
MSPLQSSAHAWESSPIKSRFKVTRRLAKDPFSLRNLLDILVQSRRAHPKAHIIVRVLGLVLVYIAHWLWLVGVAMAVP